MGSREFPINRVDEFAQPPEDADADGSGGDNRCSGRCDGGSSGCDCGGLGGYHSGSGSDGSAGWSGRSSEKRQPARGCFDNCDATRVFPYSFKSGYRSNSISGQDNAKRRKSGR